MIKILTLRLYSQPENCFLYFCQFKFDARIHLVHEFLRLYADAVAVVADGLALLEAVKHDFQAVVQVGTLVLIKHVDSD